MFEKAIQLSVMSGGLLPLMGVLLLFLKMSLFGLSAVISLIA